MRLIATASDCQEETSDAAAAVGAPFQVSVQGLVRVLPKCQLVNPQFSQDFVARRREAYSDKARADFSEGLGEDTLSKDKSSATLSE